VGFVTADFLCDCKNGFHSSRADKEKPLISHFIGVSGAKRHLFAVKK
jgi:hypothetical protein